MRDAGVQVEALAEYVKLFQQGDATKEERKNPKLLNGNRRLRIARGSGTTVQDINKFMKSFEMTQKMMRKMQNEKNLKKMMKGINPNDLKGMLK